MRQIILDTETTGLDPRFGHRVIEIAGVEMLNRRMTQRHFHRYLNPEREIDEGAQAVHGISLEFLQDKPKFADIVAEFLDFVRGAELVIHNAAFDIGFLNHELSLLGLDPIDGVCAGVLDTLKLARQMHPGKRNNLDALCERHGVSNSHRTLHGALLDAELLGEVYLAMTRGQETLSMEIESAPADLPGVPGSSGSRPPLRRLATSADDLAEHERTIAAIDKESRGNCLWKAPA
jgi:DNA polymerase-3 subunit epsilon